uniref:Poly(ADP-ribose) glycohydrolase n=1 Tax=Heterorhabditis bacteriophora TaxID=37862 RepID=A0A1I7X4R8_HETBA
MSSEESDDIDSIIPEIALSAALNGKEQRLIRKRRKPADLVINIDEDDGPKFGPVSAVVQEVQSDFDEEDMSETVKLSKNIQKARRKSIVNYFPQIKNKDKNGTTLKNFMSHEKNSTDDSLTIDVNEDEVKQTAELYIEDVTDQSATNIKTSYHLTISFQKECIEKGAMIGAEREVFNEVEGHEVEDHYVKLKEHYMEEPQVNWSVPYAMIEKALRTLSNNEAYNIHAVVTTIQECAPWVEDCSALVSFSENLSESDRSELLRTMTGIANLALRAKHLINAPLQILKRGSCRTVTLSQEQCACLLANAFFCTYRKESFGFNAFNMAGFV